MRPKSVSPKGVEGQYSSWAANYDRDTKSYGWVAPQVTLESLLKTVPPRQGLRVLDVGLGTGSASQPYLERSKVTGLDLSEKMLNEAKSRSEKYSQLAIYDINQPISSVQLKSKEFDVVVSVGTLHFASDLKKTLCELASVLSPSGVLAFTFIPQQNRTFGSSTQVHTEKDVADIIRELGLELSEPIHNFVAYHDKGNTSDPVRYARVVARKYSSLE